MMTLTQAFAHYRTAHRLHEIAADCHREMQKAGAWPRLLDEAAKVRAMAGLNRWLALIDLRTAFERI